MGRVRRMQETWEPLQITALDLSGADLYGFDVSGLVNLQSLNVSDNHIASISNGGLVTCTALTTLDLSNNRISDKEELLCVAAVYL